MAELFSDRNSPPTPRTATDMDDRTKKAFASLIETMISKNYLGYSFPETCPDNGTPCGTDATSVKNGMAGVVPEMAGWDGYYLRADQDDFRAYQDDDKNTIPTAAFLDALEWCASKVGYPEERGKWHDYYNHAHYKWDRDKGLQQFRGNINQILARNHLAYEMDEEGLIHRTAEGPPAEALKGADFETGDPETNKLLEDAREHFFNRDPDAGQNALETIWDAFERIKTHKITDKNNKKESAGKLLDDTAASTPERDLLETEMRQLTKIGNDWRIRHHEIGNCDLGDDRRLRDYLFLRMFTLLQHLLPSAHR